MRPRSERERRGELAGAQRLLAHRPGERAGVALAGALVALVILSEPGCGDDASSLEPTSAEADSFAEFFVDADSGFIFERVDRATPEPLEATEGATCFTDPGWAYEGAPYDRGDSRTDLPTGTQRGEVNVMRQCDLTDGP